MPIPSARTLSAAATMLGEVRRGAHWGASPVIELFATRFAHIFLDNTAIKPPGCPIFHYGLALAIGAVHQSILNSTLILTVIS